MCLLTVYATLTAFIVGVVVQLILDDWFKGWIVAGFIFFSVLMAANGLRKQT